MNWRIRRRFRAAGLGNAAAVKELFEHKQCDSSIWCELKLFICVRVDLFLGNSKFSFNLFASVT